MTERAADGATSTTTTPRHRIFVPTTLFSPDVVASLEAAADVELRFALPEEDRVFGVGGERGAALEARVQEALAASLGEINAIFAITVNGQLPLSPETVARAPRLNVVFVPSAGTDMIDLDVATEHGVAVLSAPGNNHVSVSQHTVGLMLAQVRRIALADRIAHREQRSSSMSELGGFPATLRGKTVAVLGFGFIGREVARICAVGFGMRVLAFDPFAHPVEAERLGVELRARLQDVLPEADFVSVHTPLTAATRHLIGAEELSLMKPGSVLINTSRGPTVDTAALTAALRAGHVAAAALDVTDPEPLPPGHELFGMDNVIFTPHSAGAAPERIPQTVAMVTQSALAALRGERPWNLANPAVWPAYLAKLEATRSEVHR